VITRLEVKDFQKHKHLRVKLSPTVTTIVGPTDAGKSALIRALQWVALGTGLRESSFVRRGASSAEVEVRAGGKVVRRSKGKGLNTYHVGGKKLAAFGAKAPDEVTSLLRLSDLNFQSQHDPVLWFSEAPGQVSRQLNKIVDLGVIDSTLKSVVDMTRHSRTEEKVVEGRIEKLKKTVVNLKPAERAEEDYRRLECLQESLLGVQTEWESLGALLETLARSGRRVSQLKRATADLAASLAAGEEWREALHSLRQLRKVSRDTLRLAKLTGATLPPFLPLQGAAARLRKTAQDRATLEELVTSAGKFFWDVEHNELQLTLQRAELEKEFRTCPLCDQKIPSSLSVSVTSTSPSSPPSPVTRKRRG
jgi:exonuclease SbcC